MLQRPDDTAEHRCCDLQRGGIVVRCDPPRLGDRQTRAEPIHTPRRTHQQYAELVDTAGNLLHHQPLAALQPPVLAGEFVQAQHRVVARVIGVMAGRAAAHLITVL